MQNKQPQTFKITSQNAGKRLDVFLFEAINENNDKNNQSKITRSQIKKHIDEKKVLINNKNKKAGEVLNIGDEITVLPFINNELVAEPENIPLDIIFEDDDLIVINKPAGMVVHPAAGNKTGTLVNALLYYCKSLSDINNENYKKENININNENYKSGTNNKKKKTNKDKNENSNNKNHETMNFDINEDIEDEEENTNSNFRAGIIHRLDKDTSGLMVVAKNNTAHAFLASQFGQMGKDKTLKREYLALIEGKFDAEKIKSKYKDVKIIKNDLPLKSTNESDINDNNQINQEIEITTRIARSEKDRKKMANYDINLNKGKLAITNIKLEKQFEKHALVRCTLKTGRTHQIRLHAAYIGEPVVFDDAYGYKKPSIDVKKIKPLFEKRIKDELFTFSKNNVAGDDEMKNTKSENLPQFLVAVKLTFLHPKTKKEKSFEIDLPNYFKEVLNHLTQP